MALIQDFTAERFEVLQGIAPTHFWFAGRRRLIGQMLSQCLTHKMDIAVDLGCGAGDALADWKQYANRVIGVDGHADLIHGNVRDTSISLMKADVSDLPLPDASAGLVFALDVLEHVQDVTTIQEVNRILSPGGTVLVAVPAHQFLWSYRDDDAGHMRRYSKRSLLDLVQGAGLIVERVLWYQFLLFPMVLVSRFLGRRGAQIRNFEDKPPAFLNWLLRSINLFEVKLNELGVAMPYGSSLLVVARKPDSSRHD